ncbi:MAG: glycosyltransferase family 4 protein [Porticoccaceae bacterium]|nr:glycosyltransferase family 4 protein [Porticoccaceae bacterium]
MNNINPFNVLYIASRGDQGAGGENYLLTLFRNIDLQKIIPIVVLPNDGSLRSPLEALGIEVIVVEADYSWLQPDIAWYRVMAGMQDRVKTLVSIINEKQIDLVHTNSNLRFEGALAARLAGIPHLYLAHIEFQPDMPIFQRLPLSLASYAQLMGELSDHVVAVSESVASTLSSHIPTQKLQVIHNGLELQTFDQALSKQSNNFRAELGIEDSDILIAAVGRIAPDKGFDYLLDAARQVLSNTSGNIHFIVVGSEENQAHAAELKQKITDYDLNKHFHFLGFRDDVPDILATSDVFVLSSRKEGHPYVMLEAMASKCAIVACNCAGVEETIDEGETGFIVPIGDSDAIARQLRLLIEDASLRTKLAGAARNKIVSSFTADKTANSLIKAYENLLALPRQSSGSMATELFIQNCRELGSLGKKNVELENRIKRLENFADLAQNNPLWKALRALRNLFR